MSAERDELKRLVEALSDEQVPQALADVRRHLEPVRDRPWPPAWFGVAEGDGTAVGARSEELLRDGFAQ
jgi:anti-sigma factor RsiW